MKKRFALAGIVGSPLLLALPLGFPNLVVVLFSLLSATFMINVPLVLILVFAAIGIVRGSIEINNAFLLVVV